MFWGNFFETLMLICFAAAWPPALYKSWTGRTRKGKSLLFLIIIVCGYCAGIIKVILGIGHPYLLVPYTFDATLVLCDIFLYYRNYRIEEGRPLPHLG